ncbi:MAG: hypothetical protein V4812_09865 [Pseudomonadota bacterium]
MNMLIKATVIAAAALLAATSASAADMYIKFDGVEGESRQAQPTLRPTNSPGAQPRPVPATADRLAQPQKPQPLLLPAVQAAREAARR